MVLASDVAAPEIRCGFNPERRPRDAQDACIPLRWSITQLFDVDQRGNETAVDKWLANKWWSCTVPATTLLSSHHSAEGNGGIGRDDHFALMNLGDHVGQQAPDALVERGHARRDAAAKTAAVTAGIATSIIFIFHPKSAGRGRQNIGRNNTAGRAGSADPHPP